MTTDAGNGYSIRVNQAVGIVSEQIRGSIADAIALIEHRASTSGQTVDQIADAIIDHSIRFDPQQ